MGTGDQSITNDGMICAMANKSIDQQLSGAAGFVGAREEQTWERIWTTFERLESTRIYLSSAFRTSVLCIK